MNQEQKSFDAIKRTTIRTAKDLCYDKYTIERLKEAKNEHDLYLAMRTAREKKVTKERRNVCENFSGSTSK